MSNNLTSRPLKLLSLITTCLCGAAALAAPTTFTTDAGTPQATRTMYVKDGVLRWHDDNSEVTLFGVNYYPPHYKDFHRLKKMGHDIRATIREDLAHFQRLGLTCLRLHTFEREFSDADGNFIDNEHVELLDYLIAECGKRNLYVILTPIAWWGSPNARPDAFAARHETIKEMVSQPEAQARQANFLTQYGKHRNRYTGKTYAEDPIIPVFELINEPLYPSEMTEDQIINYINTLADALRASGTKKPIFYSTWFNKHVACSKARIDGVTHSWYPSGLVAGYTLTADYLPSVDDFPALRHPELDNRAKMIYEFDCADILTTTMYPAMARTFRSVGVQIANQFQYEVMRLATINNNWQTHFLNLAYTPGKAIGFAIAAQAFADIPRGTDFPAQTNRNFFNVRLSHQLNLAERITDTDFMHTNNTDSMPPKPQALTRVWGVGSSPLVTTNGNGAYFLDKLDDGDWLFEVYPNAVIVRDPFSGEDTEKVRLTDPTLTFSIKLPNLQGDATLTRLDAASSPVAIHSGKPFSIAPGQYRITRQGVTPQAKLPNRDFVLPPVSKDNTPFITLLTSPECHQDLPVYTIKAMGYIPDKHDGFFACGNYADGTPAFKIPFRRLDHSTFQVNVPTAQLTPDKYIYITAQLTVDGRTFAFPGNIPVEQCTTTQRSWNIFTASPETVFTVDGSKEQNVSTAFNPQKRAILHNAPQGYGDKKRFASGTRILVTPNLPEDARPNALKVNVAGDATTTAIEIGVQMKDDNAFGRPFPITQDFQDYTLRFDTLSPLWNSTAKCLDPKKAAKITFITGTWLYPHLAAQPHSFAVRYVDFLQLPDGIVTRVLPPSAPVSLLAFTPSSPISKKASVAKAQLVSGKTPETTAIAITTDTFKANRDHAIFRFPATNKEHIASRGEKAQSIIITIKALYPQTSAVEVVFIEKDNTPWGLGRLPLTTQWQDIEIPIKDIPLFKHWKSAAPGRGGEGDCLKPQDIMTVSFCFGKFIYGDKYNMPHGFSVQNIRLK